jgi:hypothetical protein
MRIPVYMEARNDGGEKLTALLEERLPKEKIEACIGFERLVHLLTSIGERPEMIVIYTSNILELERIVSIRQLLTDTAVLLVIPDENDATLTLGHKLRPRLLIASSGDLTVIPDMLTKMRTHHSDARNVTSVSF